jgi:hypothetical protein
MEREELRAIQAPLKERYAEEPNAVLVPLAPRRRRDLGSMGPSVPSRRCCMSEDAWPKVGASAGIVTAVLLILGFVFGPSGSPPGFDDSAREVQTFIQDNHGEMQAQVALGFATLAAFAWFLGSVFYRLRAAEPHARLSAVALAGGLVLIIGGTIGTCAQGAAVYHADSLDANTVRGLWDLSVFGFLFFTVGFAVLAGASGALAIRTKVLPDWLCIVTVLAAVYAFVVGLVGSFSETGAFSPSDGALGLIAFLVFIVWLLTMGVTLVREPRATPAQTQPEARMP